MSLRARVVRSYLKIDPRKARELFESIGTMPASSYQCETRFAFYFRLYYVVMGEVLDSISDARSKLLMDYAHRLRFGSEIYPFMAVVTNRMTQFSPSDLALISHAIAEQLSNLSQDSATYTWAVNSAVQSLTRLAKALPGAPRQELLNGMRFWVVRGMNAGICQARTSTAIADHNPAPAVNPPSAFNQLVRAVGGSEQMTISGGPRPIIAGLLPSPDNFLPNRERYARIAQMLSVDGGHVNTQAEIERWRRELGAYIGILAKWGERRELQEEFYLEKSDLLMDAVGLQQVQFSGEGRSPEGSDARFLIAFLEGDVGREIYRARRAVWFAPVMFALGSVAHNGCMDSLMLSASIPELQLYGLIGRLLATKHQVYQ